jgi:hypothetical protein
VLAGVPLRVRSGSTASFRTFFNHFRFSPDYEHIAASQTPQQTTASLDHLIGANNE